MFINKKIDAIYGASKSENINMRHNKTMTIHFFSHPDFNCRFWNYTRSATEVVRGLSPPVGNYALPRRIYLYNVYNIPYIVQQVNGKIRIILTLWYGVTF